MVGDFSGNCGKNKFWAVRTLGNSGFRPRLSFSVLNFGRPADTFPGSEFPEDFAEFCFLCTPPPSRGCACRSHWPKFLASQCVCCSRGISLDCSRGDGFL